MLLRISKMARRFSLDRVLVFFFGSFLFFASLKYHGSNDLAVYNQPILAGGIYAGDAIFEYLQVVLSLFLPREYVLGGIQFLAVILAVLLFERNRLNCSKADIYLALYIFTSSVLLLGLFNSIRQSFSFLLAVNALTSRRFGWKSITTALFAIFVHKAVVLVFAVSLISKFFSVRSLRIRFGRTPLILAGVVFPVMVYFAFIFGFDLFSRYGVYITDSVTFQDNRVGSIKILVWLLVLSSILFLSSRKLFVPRIIFVATIFTILIGLDSLARGFDEFHSRLLLLNNSFLLIFVIDFIKKTKLGIDSPLLLLLLSVNLGNPSTLGVIL